MCSVIDLTLCLILSVSALYTLYTGIQYLKDVSSSDHATATLSMFFYAKTWDCDSHHSDENHGIYSAVALHILVFSYI